MMPRKQRLPDTRLTWIRVWQHLHRFKPDEVPWLKGGSGQELPSLSKKLCSSDIHLRRKISFSLRKSHCGVYKPHLKAGPAPSSRSLTQKWAQRIFVDFLSCMACLFGYFGVLSGKDCWSFACIYGFQFLCFYDMYVCLSVFCVSCVFPLVFVVLLCF